MEIRKMYLDGEWTEGTSGKVIDVVNPATGKVFDQVWESSVEDTRRAVAVAKRSFYETREWRDMDSQKRGDILLKIADKIEEHAAELARLDTMDNGKPLREAEGDVDDGIHTFRYYAGLIKAPYGGVYDVNANFGPMHSCTVREPVGVCAQITPWNYPFLMSVWKLAPALAAGNSVVFKPSPKAPLSTIRLFEIFEEAGLPRGCVNLLQGDAEVGAEMGRNTDVDMVAFTGSTRVGQSLMRAAAGNVKKIGLELGGKSPNVIFADADLDGAVEWAMIGIFFNQGEVCSAGSRIIIEESVRDEFVKKLAERANAMTIGNGLENPDMGPLITQKDMEKVLGYIRSGIEEGAALVCGGERYTENGCADGYFVRPTIFDRCTPDMKIVREEIFGPVVTVQTFCTEAEAVALANDTDYGLAGAVFTSDVSRAVRVIKEIRAGITWVNCYNPTFNEAPWGGYKRSGIGRELGVHGLEEYQEVKQINLNLAPGPVGWYQH
ncbi:MAG: aldehyde dehydrogenase family protein [Oscillospiraceae bacterium]|jgi:betaine-aldehyde dehydrogenase|nr:aldehyde dehydrogenase family protein [Oscillospiraceae bacterium]MCI1990608.1 aldehyde dehydrogenase family protein [Oscillospiraceae bacterium]MCI2035517.1 aldehyde dehydrogenase family protein [Oscillospiraceae bacterium]